MLISKSTTLAVEIGVEVAGLRVVVAAFILFQALATNASSRATLGRTAPTLDLKFIKQTWPSVTLSMAWNTRWTSTFRMGLHFKVAALMRRMLPLTVISYRLPTPLSHGLQLCSRKESLFPPG